MGGSVNRQLIAVAAARLLVAALVGIAVWPQQARAHVLSRVACPSVHQCTAVDGSGLAVTFDPASPGGGTRRTIDIAGDRALKGIACPSATQCTAVDGSGGEITFDPSARLPGARIVIERGNDLTGVACPTATWCTAVDAAGNEVSFDPGAPGHPSAVMINSPPDAYTSTPPLTGIACPSVGRCSTVDNLGDELTFDPEGSGNAVASSLKQNAFGGDDGTRINGIACATFALCTGVDAGGYADTFNPGSTAGPNSVQIDSESLTAVACPTPTQCTAVDRNGSEVTFNPAAAGTPSPWPISPGSRLRGVACPSASQCTAVGADIEVTFDPSDTTTAVQATIDPGPAVTAGNARATGFGIGHAKLSFELAAAGTASPVRMIAIKPPAGLAFAHSGHDLAQGIMVLSDGAPVKLRATVTHGQLRIVLRAPAPTVEIAISRPAIRLTRALATGVKTGEIRTLTFTIEAGDTAEVQTKIVVRMRAS
jgi:hypothetical protein